MKCRFVQDCQNLYNKYHIFNQKTNHHLYSLDVKQYQIKTLLEQTRKY
jgi:hypothetical protein